MKTRSKTITTKSHAMKNQAKIGKKSQEKTKRATKTKETLDSSLQVIVDIREQIIEAISLLFETNIDGKIEDIEQALLLLRRVEPNNDTRLENLKQVLLLLFGAGHDLQGKMEKLKQALVIKVEHTLEREMEEQKQAPLLVEHTLEREVEEQKQAPLLKVNPNVEGAVGENPSIEKKKEE